MNDNHHTRIKYLNLLCICAVIYIYAFALHKSKKTKDALHEIQYIIENTYLRYIQLITSIIWYLIGLICPKIPIFQ